MNPANGWVKMTTETDIPRTDYDMQILFNGDVLDAHLELEDLTSDGGRYGWYDNDGIRITCFQDARVMGYRYVDVDKYGYDVNDFILARDEYLADVVNNSPEDSDPLKTVGEPYLDENWNWCQSAMDSNGSYTLTMTDVDFYLICEG